MNISTSERSHKQLFSNHLPSLLVVIPARSGSKRLPDKNIQLYSGRPMMINAALAAQQMSCRPRVLISTDSSHYSSIARSYSIECLIRPSHLGCDSSPKLDVIKHACISLYQDSSYLPQNVLSLQANSLRLSTQMLDQVYNQHIKKACNVLNETVSINSNGDQNGAIRLVSIASLFQNSLSTYLSTYTVDLPDVHTLEDLIDVV